MLRRSVKKKMSSYSQASTQPVDELKVDVLDVEENSKNCVPDTPWGKLYPARKSVKSHELKGNLVTVGKNSLCDVCIHFDELPSAIWGVFSRQHFQLKRVVIEAVGALTYKIMLEDLSMNGTYVNEVKVGKGQSKELRDNDVIAIGRLQYEVFYFHDCNKESSINNRFPQIVKHKYDVSKRLGSGAFGDVYLVFHKKTGKGYAMKTILKEENDGPVNHAKVRSELLKLDNEINILKNIKHPNIIHLLDSLTCGKDKFLFLELMEGRDLFQRIFSCVRLTETQSKLYFYQILSGVQYLHNKAIFHRDLKPENVLLATGDVETVVKITDFGLSKVLHSKTYLSSLCGTKMYVAPEVLESEGWKKYTGQVDVWSMGVILYVCLSGTAPFADRQDLRIEDQIKAGRYQFQTNRWECVSNAAKRLVRKMMTVNPDERITVSNIFQDAWLQDEPMKAKVNALISEFESSQIKENHPVPYSQEKRDIPIRCLNDKENVPAEACSSEDETLDTSPHPASSIKLMSPPSSPYPLRRKRARIN